MENPTLPGVYGLLKAASLLPAKGAVNTPEAISRLLHGFCIWGCYSSRPPRDVAGAGGVLARGGSLPGGSESPYARAQGRGREVARPCPSPQALRPPGLAEEPGRALPSSRSVRAAEARAKEAGKVPSPA